MPKILVKNRDDRVLEVDAECGISIMENIRDLDASVEAICGGMCACATCHVYVDAVWQEQLPPRSFEEQRMLEDLDFFDAERSRLSCQIEMAAGYDGIELAVAPEE